MDSQGQRGFTLLELMVTLVVIGILSTFALLSLRGSDESDLLGREVQRLHALIEINQQEALLQSEQRGIFFTETGYHFMSRDGSEEWQRLEDPGFRQSHNLPSGMTLALWVDNLNVDVDKTRDQRPQVMLLSSGESTDFRVVFDLAESDISGFWVASDLTGNLRIGSGQ